MVRHKLTWRSIIPETFKSLALAVRLHKSLLRFVDLTLILSDVTNRSLLCIVLFLTLICIYCEILKVLPVIIQKLSGFGKFGFLTFDLLPDDHHPSKVVRHKFPIRSTIPENIKSLASAVQKP